MFGAGGEERSIVLEEEEHIDIAALDVCIEQSAAVYFSSAPEGLDGVEDGGYCVCAEGRVRGVLGEGGED